MDVSHRKSWECEIIMNKRTITVFYDGSHYIFRWLKALFAARKEFKQHGFKVEYADIQEYFMHKFDVNKTRKKLEKKHYDIIFFAYHHDAQLFELPEEAFFDLLKLAKKQSNYFVWLDTADSTGTCHFEVLPFVDRYLKKQLLIDLNEYKTPIWGGRIHCQYYHEKYGLDDKNISGVVGEPLDPQYMNKIGVAWNVALGDLFQNGGLQYLHPFSKKKPKFIKYRQNKIYDTHFRGSAWSEVAGFQRRVCAEKLLEHKELKFPDPTQKVPKNRYNFELKNTRSVISPFGWGEICGRDFECFSYGAALIKPAMEHLRTFPQWYLDGKTYIGIDWDFENFHEKIDMLKNQPDKIQAIAENGQAMMRYYWSKEGRVEFVNHIIDELKLS